MLVSRRSLPSDPVALARWLIGKRIVRAMDGRRLGGRIVETEAYLANDPASHSFGGPTSRNRAMFSARGHAYVYRIYGMWFCLNVAAGAIGHGAAVLVRAVEPEFGVADMGARRGGATARDIARGPGRLCAALAIDRTLDGADLCTNNGLLWLERGGKPVTGIAVSTRIGITKAPDAQLRFYERGSAYVSGPASLRG
jgi:DNA-3-methyladenine glycosylase